MLQTARFFADGTALIHCGRHEEGRRFRYRLGPLQGQERELELHEDGKEDDAPLAGTLIIARSRMYRCVKIPELNIDLKDIRYLRRVGATALDQKLALEFPWTDFLETNETQQLEWLARINPSRTLIPSDEDEIRNALDRAWVYWQWQMEQQSDFHVMSLAEMYDFSNRTAKTAKQTQTHTQRRQKAVKTRKSKHQRWERPKI